MTKYFSRSLVLLMALGAALTMQAAVIGGNAVISRPFVDGFANWSVLDRNAPITTSASINQWQVYAANTGQVELLIYRSTGVNTYSLVGNSTLQTPTVGLNTFTLASPISVLAGDVVGLFFPGQSSVVYTLDPPGSNAFGNLTGKVLYTNNNAGFVNNTNFVDSTNRTYSVLVGTNLIPEPATLTLFGGGLLAFALIKRRR
jgi:PEP-CTERM motif